MSELFVQKDVQKLFLNKFIVILGSSVQRSMYKDLVKMLKKDVYLSDKELRAKGEAKFEDDDLIDGGPLCNNVTYREVREYKTDYHLIRFYFITRAYNKYVESIIESFKAEPKPDVIILNSCVWDITRYGLGPESAEAYRQNLHKMMKKLKAVLNPSCLVIWGSTLAVDKEAKGGLFVPEVESAKTQLGAKILACNLIAYNITKQYDYDYIDLHYYLRHHLHRRAEDGVHWDMTAHRRMSNLILFQIAEAWGLKQSEQVSPTTPNVSLVSSLTSSCNVVAATATPALESSTTTANINASTSSESSLVSNTISTTAPTAGPAAITVATTATITETAKLVTTTSSSVKTVSTQSTKTAPTATAVQCTKAGTSTAPKGLSDTAKSVQAPASTAAVISTSGTSKAATTMTTTKSTNVVPALATQTKTSIGPIKSKKKKRRQNKIKVQDNHKQYNGPLPYVVPEHHRRLNGPQHFPPPHEEPYPHPNEFLPPLDNFHPHDDFHHPYLEHQENIHPQPERFHSHPDEEYFHRHPHQENIHPHSEHIHPHPHEEYFHRHPHHEIIRPHSEHIHPHHHRTLLPAPRNEIYDFHRYDDNRMHQIRDSIDRYEFTDFTKDTFFDQGQYRLDDPRPFQPKINENYDWHEYPHQYEGGFNSYEASHGELYRGMRYQL